MLHRLDLTPERGLATLVSAALCLPFFLAFETLLRRGGMVTSTIRCSIGRGLIVALIALGVTLNLLPFILMLALPIIAIELAQIEIFAASAYAVSGNLFAIALAESLWFGWLAAVNMPITFMF
jgi:hypothetical protein